MRPLITALSILLLAHGLSAAAETPGGRPDPKSLDALLAAPPFAHALWGVQVEDESGRTIYSKNATVLVPVASVRKLFAATAIAECGDIWSPLPTEFLIQGEIRDSRLNGDLFVRGSGDPSLAGRHDPARDVSFAPLLAALQRLGISEIAGAVVGDGSRFEPLRYPPGWKRSVIGTSYAAPISALAFNENAAGVFIRRSHCPPSTWADPPFVRTSSSVTCGRSDATRAVADPANLVFVSGTITKAAGDEVELISIADPDLYAASGVADFLEGHGIRVNERARSGRSPVSARVVATAHALTRYELLDVMLRQSQNTYAEMLFKAISDDPVRSWRDALDREREVLVSKGINTTQFRFADGSGLAPENLATSRSIVAVVRILTEREAIWQPLLARPGKEGTLKRRLAGLEDRLTGKTGSIEGVNALAGWVDGKNGGRRYFSIVVANHTATSRQGSERVDALVRMLADF